MKVFSDENERQFLFSVAASGGSVSTEEFKNASLSARGIFSHYSSSYAPTIYENTLQTLKSGKMITEEEGNLTINGAGLIEKMGKSQGDQQDAEFILTLQNLQRLNSEFKAFVINESLISLPSYMGDISEEIITAYKLFKNAESSSDYALVIAACGRAVEKIRNKLESTSDSTEKKAVLNGANLIYFMRNKEGAHVEKKARRVEALSCLLNTLTICNIIDEFKLLES